MSSCWRIECKGRNSLSASNICLEEDEEEDMFVILEGVVEGKKKKKTDLPLNVRSLVIEERDKV